VWIEDSPELIYSSKEVVREMTVKSRPKMLPRYDAPFVPAKKIEAVQAALIARVTKSGTYWRP